MGKTIKVNWKYVSKLAEKTLLYAERYENIRQSMISIIESMNSCWQGDDYDSYKSSVIFELKKLKNDAKYMLMWSEFFKKSSEAYCGVLDNYEDRFNRIKASIENKDKKPPIYC